jgi:hypothetical protein
LPAYPGWKELASGTEHGVAWAYLRSDNRACRSLVLAPPLDEPGSTISHLSWPPSELCSSPPNKEDPLQRLIPLEIGTRTARQDSYSVFGAEVFPGAVAAIVHFKDGRTTKHTLTSSVLVDIRKPLVQSNVSEIELLGNGEHYNCSPTAPVDAAAWECI